METENENTVETSVEENVEGIELTDTEQKEEVKMYTEDEFNTKLDDLLSKKIARERRKIEREYENKYSDYRDIGNIVSQALEATDIKDAKNKAKSYYEEQGMTFDTNRYSDKEEKILGKSDAEDIIDLGLDVAEEEANRLSEVGYDKLSVRDKTKFNILATALTDNKNKQELKQMGVSEDILTNKEFNEFSKQFNSSTPLTKIYEMYKLTQPKKEVNIIGSMKGNATKPDKEFYTDAELDKLTLDELKDPVVWEKVRKSMIK